MRNQKIIYALICLILIIAGYTPIAAEASENISSQTEVFTRINEYIQREMEAYQIPGLALGIVQGNEIIYTKGYGKANLKGEPVDQDTPFYIGSIGKTFTALAIRQLEGEGKLKVTDSVQKYIPWFTLADNTGGQITLKELLIQTSGLSTVSGNEAFTYNSDYSIEESVKKINRRIRTNRPIGEAYEYSNLNYVILGLVVEYVSGMSYEDYINKNIFGPMGMNTSFVSKAEAKEHGLAQGYRNAYGFNIPIDYSYPNGQVSSGFQICSARDMAKYMINFLNNGYAEGNSILPNNTLSEPEDTLVPFRNGAPYYSMDWGISRDPVYNCYNRFYGFNGATANFNSTMLISQVNRYGVIVLANNFDTCHTPRLTANVIANGITDILLGKAAPSSDRKISNKMQIFIPYITAGICMTAIAFCVSFGMKRKTVRRLPVYVSMAVINFILPLGMLVGLPIYYDNHWSFLLTFRMEYLLPIFLISIVLILIGIIKLLLLVVRKRSGNKPVIRGEI